MSLFWTFTMANNLNHLSEGFGQLKHLWSRKEQSSVSPESQSDERNSIVFVTNLKSIFLCYNATTLTNNTTCWDSSLIYGMYTFIWFHIHRTISQLLIQKRKQKKLKTKRQAKLKRRTKWQFCWLASILPTYFRQ